MIVLIFWCLIFKPLDGVVIRFLDFIIGFRIKDLEYPCSNLDKCNEGNSVEKSKSSSDRGYLVEEVDPDFQINVCDDLSVIEEIDDEYVIFEPFVCQFNVSKVTMHDPVERFCCWVNKVMFWIQKVIGQNSLPFLPVKPLLLILVPVLFVRELFQVGKEMDTCAISDASARFRVRQLLFVRI